MLFALILAIILGTSGAESEFASSIPNIKREIRQNVPEKARKDSLLVLVKEYEKVIKKYDKEKKRFKKDMNKTSSDWEKSTDVYLSVSDAYYESRAVLLARLIDYRLQFQQQLTEEELQLVTEKAGISSKKELRQDDKAKEKAEKELMKVFRGINEIVVKHLGDSAKTEIISEGLHNFETTIYAYVDEAIDLVIARQIKLDDKNATKEEIEEIYLRSEQLRYKASRDFAELREELIKNTSQRQWKAINKEFKMFLKN